MRLPVSNDSDSPATSPWYADGLSFTCTQCGNCCTGGPGYVWVSEQEIDRFAAHLRIDRKAFLKTYCRSIQGEVSLKERRTPAGEYDCVFLKHLDPSGQEVPPAALDRHGRTVTTRRVCSVYDVRPLQCRTWPFWDGNLADRDAWQSAHGKCPGMGTGRAYTQAQIEALRDAEDWPDKPPGSA